jgi:hypothetical protein
MELPLSFFTVELTCFGTRTISSFGDTPEKLQRQYKHYRLKPQGPRQKHHVWTAEERNTRNFLLLEKTTGAE